MTTSTFALKKVKIAEKQVLEKLEHAKKKKKFYRKKHFLFCGIYLNLQVTYHIDIPFLRDKM